MSQIVNLLCILVNEAFNRNDTNILALNNLLMANFHLRIAGTPGSAGYVKQELVDLDDVLSTASGLRNMNYLRWKWMVEVTPENKV